MSQGGVLGKEATNGVVLVRTVTGSLTTTNSKSFTQLTTAEKKQLLNGPFILFDYSISLSSASSESFSFGLGTSGSANLFNCITYWGQTTSGPFSGQIGVWKLQAYHDSSTTSSFMFYIAPTNSSFSVTSLPYDSGSVYLGVLRGSTASITISYTIKLYAITL